MNTQHIAIAAVALIVGYMVGKRQAAAGSSGPAAHNETNTAADWWSYAGNWSV